MTPIDEAYGRTRDGDHEGFAAWVRRVEMPLRLSLRSFARVVDVEAIVQEGLLRMWVLAPTLELQGENASLRYARTLTRNLAIHEARLLGSLVPLDHDGGNPGHDVPVPPAPVPDPALRSAIVECLERLPAKPAEALLERLRGRGSLPDRDLAALAGMTLNTFLQNIVRARRHMAECLRSKGIELAEVAR